MHTGLQFDYTYSLSQEFLVYGYQKNIDLCVRHRLCTCILVRECPGMFAGSHPNLSGQERLSAFIKHRPTFLQLNKAATKERRYILKSRADSPIQLVSFSIHYLFYSSLMNRLFPCHAISTNSLSIRPTSFLSFLPPIVPFLLSLSLFSALEQDLLARGRERRKERCTGKRLCCSWGSGFRECD